MKTTRMITAFTIAMAILGSQHASGDETIVAKLGGREVKAAEIKPYLADLSPADRESLVKDRAALAQFVRGILVRKAVLADAAAVGWEEKPEVARGLGRVRDQYLVESYLLEVSKVPADYPPEEEVKKVYAAERANLELPRRVELSQIFISAADGDDQAKGEATQLASELKDAPGDFGRLAREKSDDSDSALRDGKIGWLTEASIAPEIRSAVGKLSKGEVSDPVKGREGYHIVRLDDVREAGLASYEEAAPQLRQALREQRTLGNRDAHLAALLEKQPVSVNELELDGLAANQKD